MGAAGSSSAEDQEELSEDPELKTRHCLGRWGSRETGVSAFCGGTELTLKHWGLPPVSSCTASQKPGPLSPFEALGPGQSRGEDA